MDNNHATQRDVISSARDVAARMLPVDADQIDAVTDQVRELDQRARAFVRDNPTTSVVAAIAVGFFIGRLLRS